MSASKYMAMFNTAFTTETPASLTSPEIGALRGKLISFLDDLHSKRMRMQTGDYKTISEHIKYCLTTLSNMDNVLMVSRSDPYQSPYGDYSGSKTLVYNSDGSSRIVSSKDVPSKGEDWERQFDQGLLQRPPCYVMPPQTVTSIPHLRNIAQRQ